MKYLIIFLFGLFICNMQGQTVTRKIGDITFAGINVCETNSYIAIIQGKESYCALKNDTIRVYFIDDNTLDFINTSKDNCTGQFSFDFNQLDLALLKSKTIVALGWVGRNENKLLIFNYDMNVLFRNALEELRCK